MPVGKSAADAIMCGGPQQGVWPACCKQRLGCVQVASVVATMAKVAWALQQGLAKIVSSVCCLSYCHA
jgi:hypothetical protein